MDWKTTFLLKPFTIRRWFVSGVGKISLSGQKGISLCGKKCCDITMPSNVEIKARVTDTSRVHHLAEQLSGCEGTLIVQDDTFFTVPQGRLKLRVLLDKPSQLIYYERSDQSGPKQSDYHITEITKHEDLKVTLGKALGIKGQVKKRRMLYMVGQTRVHVDEVDGLGNFMELEVQMKETQTAAEGEAIAHDLMKKLEISKEHLMEGAYMDLLLAK